MYLHRFLLLEFNKLFLVFFSFISKDFVHLARIRQSLYAHVSMATSNLDTSFRINFSSFLYGQSNWNIVCVSPNHHLFNGWKRSSLCCIIVKDRGSPS